MGAARELTLDQFGRWADERGRALGSVDLRPAWGDVALLLVSDTRENFDGQHGPGGTPWPPLAHPRPQGGDKALRSRGLLMASFVAGGDGHVEEATPTSFAWGSNHEHAAVHQDGAVIRPTRGKALAIPLTAEATKYSPRGGGGLPPFPRPLFVPKGRRVLAESRGKGKRAVLVPQYFLAPEVEIPARPMAGFHPRLVERVGDVVLARLDARMGG